MAKKSDTPWKVSLSEDARSDLVTEKEVTLELDGKARLAAHEAVVDTLLARLAQDPHASDLYTYEKKSLRDESFGRIYESSLSGDLGLVCFATWRQVNPDVQEIEVMQVTVNETGGA